MADSDYASGFDPFARPEDDKCDNCGGPLDCDGEQGTAGRCPRCIRKNRGNK